MFINKYYDYVFSPALTTEAIRICLTGKIRTIHIVSRKGRA